MIASMDVQRTIVEASPRKLDKILAQKVSRAYGAVSTPIEIVELMIKISGVSRFSDLKILEPGAGFCDFSSAIKRMHPRAKIAGVEINPEIYEKAREMFPEFQLHLADFLLWDTEQRYDLIIGNPPYGIVGHSSHYPIHVLRAQKDLYKQRFKTWYGKYNVYGAFIEKGIELLAPGGRLVYIVPATWMILEEFKLLRKFLSLSGKLRVFYLGEKVFLGRNVSTVIIRLDIGNPGQLVLFDLSDLRTGRICYKANNYKGELIRFEDDFTRGFQPNSVNLGELFEMRFAARSPEVKEHPAVEQAQVNRLVPVLTGRNLRRGSIDYTNCYSGLWMPKERAGDLREWYRLPRIVVGHTKGGRVIAAVEKRGYPWHEEIHLLPKNPRLDLMEICEYLNSDAVQTYMKTLYREITPHVTITQLELLPVPKSFAHITQGT